MSSQSLARILLVWIVASSLPILPSAAAAVLSLPDASYNLICDGQVEQTPVPGELSCSSTEAIIGPPSWERVTTGIAEAYAGLPEFPSFLPPDVLQSLQGLLGQEDFILLSAVQVETTVTTTEHDSETDLKDSHSVGGIASLSFAVGVEQIATPPIALDEVPVTIHIVGEARINGNANSFALLLAQGTLGVLRWDLEGPGSISVDEVIDTEFFQIGEGYLFSKDVQCQAVTNEVRGWVIGDTDTADCVAVLDPIFELDQARFDALAGSSTFPLDEYFVLRYSPNLPISQPILVPTLSPGAAVIFLCGALLVTGWAALRNGSRTWTCLDRAGR